MKKLAVMVSGNGSNLQALIDATRSGEINAKIALVISSSACAYALERARKFGIDKYVAVRSDYATAQERDKYILKLFAKYDIDYVVTAGYLGMITPIIVEQYRNRIVNIHPSLLPKYGGKGMYGIYPHVAAISAGDTVSGATVHFVDEGMDTGHIIAQKSTEILADETPQALQSRILKEIEHQLLVDTVKLLCQDKIHIENDKVIINNHA